MIYIYFLSHPISFCYQHTRSCDVVMNNAFLLQAENCIDQVHSNNKKGVQVQNKILIFQVFVQRRVFREVVTQ